MHSSAALVTLLNTDHHIETAVVGAEETGDRLDRVLAHHIASLSRSRLKALVLAGNVTVAGMPVRDPEHRVSAGDNISVEIPRRSRRSRPAKPLRSISSTKTMR